MKFKLDENLPTEAGKLLRQAGHDALSVLDQNLGGEDDSRIVTICRQEERILLTFDVDFANIRSYPPSKSAGLIVFRLASQEKRHLLEVLERLLGNLDRDDPSGQLWIVEEDRLRIRE